MNKTDYLAQVENLHASQQLRERIAALPAARRQSRRFKPWMGVCAGLAVVVLGGFWLLPRIGGSSGGAGAGHDEASTFMSYAGPVFPLTTLEDVNLTAERHITLDFAPWQDGNSTKIQIKDSYVLTNPTDTDLTVTLVYPFAGSFYELYPVTLTADGTELETVIYPGVGGNQSVESWEEYAAIIKGGDLAAAHQEAPTLDTPVTVYSFTDFVLPESDAAAPTLAVTYPWSEDAPAVLTYGFDGSGIDEEAGWAQRQFSLPDSNSPHAEDPRLLIVVGDPLEEYTIQGYQDGGCTPGEELAGVSAHVTQYQSTLGDVLDSLCQAPDTLDQKYGKPMGVLALPRAVFFDTLCKSFGTSIPSNMTMLEMVFEWCNIQERIFYGEATLTIPAGERVTVEASFTKEGSYDFVCAHTENRGIYGYDLLTQLGSNLTCTQQTAILEDRGLIQIARQNFGFDLNKGIKTVSLDPSTEHYYLEVRRAY
ncbi:hypothetical protein [Flavonifractor sp. An112]|uniref:hypothetical protein n=1 Tax=Flavonifractor sp. An112 TaxID=1965544 RepID=UPI00174E78C2|nr:hypothetical protein [Flavonifractor sp. An112]